MALIRFKHDCDGFLKGQTVDLGAGVADAYVSYRHVADYVQANTIPAIEQDTPGYQMRDPKIQTRRNAGPREGANHGR